MADVQSIVNDLKGKGNEKTRIIYARHGHPVDRTYGVSMADLKTVAKTIKGEQALAYGLFETGYLDAMYLAGMVANGAAMPRPLLQTWAEQTVGMPMISDYTVPWVTVENPAGGELVTEWIRSSKEHVIVCGWSSYAGLVTTQPDKVLDLPQIQALLEEIVKEAPRAKDRVKLKMNGFVIAVGSYVEPLLEQAKSAAQQLGALSADMGDTACKIPFASEYISKAEAMGRVGQKRKTIRC